jgi:hypothetical protein
MIYPPSIGIDELKRIIAIGKLCWSHIAQMARLPAMEVGSPPDLSSWEKAVCLEMQPAMQMDFFSCGTIAGWSVLKALYPSRTEKDRVRFYKRCDPCPKTGTSTERLVRALEMAQVKVTVKQDNLLFATIRRALLNGHPLIVCLDCPGTDEAHWTVVYGCCSSSRGRHRDERVVLLNNRKFWQGAEMEVMPYRRFRELQIRETLVCSTLTGDGIARRMAS